MKLSFMLPGSLKSEKGQALALLAVTMVGLLGIAALGVDLGYLYVARNELQNIADGSALAGARVLGNVYQGLSYSEQATFVCDTWCPDSIRSQADSVAHLNRAAALQMALRDVDIEIGQWDGDAFTATPNQPDAVMVTARRDLDYNGPVTTFFARVLGIDASSVNAVAVAALTGQGNAWPGELELPIGISRWFFENHQYPDYCNEDIQFYPTNDPASCAGWTSWDNGSSDVNLRHILDEDEGYDNPHTIAGETYFNFTGGTLSEPTFDAMLSLFQREGYDTQGDAAQTPSSWYGDNPDPTGPVDLGDLPWPDLVPLIELDQNGDPVIGDDGLPVQMLYPDGSPRFMHAWETTVPVYDRLDCSNPNQEILIIGFAEIILTDVLNAPSKYVAGKVKCDVVDEFGSRGGGGEYGVKGSIPGLVW